METPRARTMQTNVELRQTTATLCEKCGGEAFQEALLLRRVSALLTGSGKEGYLPIQVFACAKCGHVNSNFVPEEVRTSISPIVT
jgi:predicted nucleic-acid-binding Zn-ribbon protein